MVQTPPKLDRSISLELSTDIRLKVSALQFEQEAGIRNFSLTGQQLARWYEEQGCWINRRS